MDRYRYNGLTFDVTDSGPTDGRVVMLLHGFPEDRHCWDDVERDLVAAGYRVLAPDQRGYSPGARPRGRRAYRVDNIVADALALADTAGAERFDVVGHDWGALVAWALAAHHPKRVRSVAALSVPHPQAFLRAMTHSTQLLHSWYMLFFQLPGLPEMVMRAQGGTRFADSLAKAGLSPEVAKRYAARAAAGDLTGPINWYRALPFDVRDGTGQVEVPALFIWGENDGFITSAAAKSCGRYVSGPYRFEALSGEGHFLPTVAAARVAPLLLEHLASV